MEQSNALIIFLRNPVLGKVKTRLAATIGNIEALKIYTTLLNYTLLTAKKVNAQVYLFFADYINEDLVQTVPNAIGVLQQGEILGERMSHAFEYCFNLKHKQVCIIGTDCPAITATIINNGFNLLKTSNVVIGPARDGGYYLLALKEFQNTLFQNINWSTATVLQETLSICKEQNLLVAQLLMLSDVDEERDLIQLNLLK
jgi:uncharacterized protein